MKANHTRLSAGMGMACLLVSATCLSASLYQAKLFINGAMGHTPEAAVMVFGVLGALLSSQVIARLVGQSIAAKAPFWAILLGVMSITIIEGLSVGISTVSFDGNLLASSRTTNQSSPEYRAIQENIAVYKSQIKSLQNQSDALPADWITRKRELNQQITDIQSRIMEQQQQARTVNVSTADQAFSRMEDAIGFGQDKIALIMGLLLSLCPMTVNLLAGSLGWSNTSTVSKSKTARGTAPAKKPKPNLRAVPA